ncbi:hypothetical protein CSA80_04895 [Candidatus Saccharibacteria bacterium]|nr:MAG: hypothetical protein CSA80_04895 [Candidatus Saccharibacteria bacterium]
MLAGSIIITSLSQVLLLLFVLRQSRKNLTNMLFGAIGAASLAWALSSYLSIVFIESDSIIFIVRIILFCVVLQNAAFYLFAHTFPCSKWQLAKKKRIIYFLLSLVVALLTLSPFVFTSVERSDGPAITNVGPAMALFVVHALYSITSGFHTLIVKYRTATRAIVRAQLRTLLVASFLVWVVVPFTNFAITPLLKTTFFIELSPVYTFLFNCIIAYSIVAQRLFGVRIIIARSFAYVLTIATFVGIYVSIVFGLLAIFAKREGLSAGVQAIYVLAALLLAFSFARLKLFFDKLSNRIFFRDAYSPQVLLNDLNEALVAKKQLRPLLKGSLNVLAKHIQISGACYVVNKTEQHPRRIIGEIPNVSDSDVSDIAAKLVNVQEKVINLNLWGHDEELPVDTVSSKEHVAIVVKLSPSVRDTKGTLGYLLLGQKRSGQLYSVADMQLLEIIASELAIAIENALRYEQIEGFNAVLQSRVDTATRKLRASNEKLRKLDETKDEFISMASHQLRTPLTSVKGYLSMILEGDAGPLKPQQEQLIKLSYLSSQRMVNLIADLLNLSRLSTGKFVIESGPTDLRVVVDQEVAQLRESAKAKNITFIWDMPKVFHILPLDEGKMHQVVMNFIDNAIHYTPEGGTITVALNETEKIVEFSVRDTGIGVPRKLQRHLFTKFYRADNARRMRPDGTGLGLYMAKKVVVAQGGAVIFESVEGKGSMFGFRFPKK